MMWCRVHVSVCTSAVASSVSGGSICTTCGGWWYVLPCYVVWIATDGMYAIYVVVAISGSEV